MVKSTDWILVKISTETCLWARKTSQNFGCHLHLNLGIFW